MTSLWEEHFRKGRGKPVNTLFPLQSLGWATSSEWLYDLSEDGQLIKELVAFDTKRWPDW